MTNQEVFDKVVAHARQQGCKSLMENVLHPEEGPLCAYRGKNGTKCFAGIFIPDEDYQKSYEKKVSMAVFHAIGITDMDEFLVRDLQIIHDKYDVEEWEGRFQVLARNWELVYKEPT
jgi:hypothetical protein